MDVWAVRGQLAAALAAVVSDPKLTVLSWVPDSNPPLPCAYVQPQSCDPVPTYDDGVDDVLFSVIVLVSRTDDKSSQQRLDALLPLCRAALEGADLDLGPVRWQGYGWRGQGLEQQPHLGAELSFTVTG